ncbi:hypothetical protein F5X99DRAFT_426577 [Biscogniauxia marginata]|nr:hypothetical protein F5X99DRAFT_426577 [Biscogniauxia marginata]
MAPHSDSFSDESTYPEPCPSRHPSPPAYIRRNQDRPNLETRKYKARDLLNCTVGSFFDVPGRELSKIQRKAKEEFLKSFDSYMKLTEAELHAKGLHQVLKGLMQQVDDYFFFGSLTRGPPAIIKLIICDSKAIPGILGRCDYVTRPGGRPRCFVRIAQDRGEEPRQLPDLVESVLHEMIHAYIHAFVCNLSRCERNHLNTTGVFGSRHGPTFRALVYAVMVCMARWRPSLREHFHKSTCGRFVEPDSFSEESNELKAAKNNGELAELLPLVKAPSHLHLIQIWEDKVIIDSERLRAHVKKYAAKPKSRIVYSSQDSDEGEKREPEEHGKELKAHDEKFQNSKPSEKNN